MPITASMLDDLIACPHRISMELFADPAERDEVSPFIRTLWQRGASHEQEIMDGGDIEALDLSGYQGDEKERLTTLAMEQQDYSGKITADNLIREPDLLRWTGNGYQAGDIKSGAAEEGREDLSKPKVHYGVQVALYTDILERKGLSAGRTAFIIDITGQEFACDLEENGSRRVIRQSGNEFWITTRMPVGRHEYFWTG